MGFGCEISRVNKRSKKPLTINDYSAINDYFNYMDNLEYYKDQFNDFEDYVKRFGSDKVAIDTETAELFREDYIMRDYNKSIFEDIEFWCSDGRYFHDWIIQNLSDSDSVSESGYDAIRLTKEKCLKLLKYCTKRLSEMEIIPVELCRAFTEKWDDDEVDLSTIISVPCDGIEVVDDNGNIDRLYGTNTEETDIYTLKDCGRRCDYENYRTHLQLLNAVTNLLNDTDWDNQDVFYSGGW